MKTIICGPPHSGKSVFITNLIRLLPSGYYLRINANGDGEGTWSNNPNQDEVMRVRVKGSNTAEDFQRWKAQIESASQDIVIVDIGGRLQDDKIPLFEVSDSFVVVSNNEDMMAEWIRFGSSHGCKCVGTILTSLGDLEESVLSLEPYVRCEMTGLERGHSLEGSKVISAIADTIVSSSGFKGYEKHGGTNVIDMYDLGIKLGMSRHWTTKTGIPVHNVWYQPERAHALHEYASAFFNEDVNYQIVGARSIWASCLLAASISSGKPSRMEVSGVISDKFIPVRKLPTCSEVKGKMTFALKETADAMLLEVTIPHRFTPKDRDCVVLPEIDLNKKLLLSGKIPSWLAMSIIISYDNAEKYVHAPGIGFIKVEDRISNNHGEIISFSD